MSRRLPALVAAALGIVLAIAFALREEAPLPAGRRTSGGVQYGAVPDPEAGICVSLGEHARLRLSRELGGPARPTLSRDPAERPRDLGLRMDRMLDTVVPVARAETRGTEAPASGESAAAVQDDAARPAEPAPTPVPAAVPQRAQSRGPIRLDLLARARDLGEPAGESGTFAPKSWVVVVPPPPPPPPLPPEPPRAPPLPFRFAGTLDDGAGRLSFFLMRGNAMLTVAVGDTIDNAYTLDSADGGVLRFTFLPLRERQQLPYGVPR